MKKLLILIIASIFMLFTVKAQDVNWRALQQKRHVVGARYGVDFAAVTGLSYGHKISDNLPIIARAEFTIPFGKSWLDDWKLRLTANGELFHNKWFSIGFKPGIVVRRYESDVARLYNVSAEATVSLCYLRPKWGIGVEANYDRSIATNIENSRLKEYYPYIRDGWYGTTGGTVKLGIAANYSFRNTGIFLKAGQVFGQDLEHNPTIPFYFDLSVAKYFGRG